MLSITFLGTSGSIPTVERGMPSVAIRYNGELFLFDCGEGTQRQLMRYKIGYGSIRALFISHLHLDHYLGVFGLLETLKLTSPSPKQISIFAPPGLPSFERHKFVQVHEIRKKDKIYEDANFSISAFPVKHSATSFGFVFEEKPKRKFYEDKAHALGLNGEMFREIQKKRSITVNGKKILLEDVSWLRKGRKIAYSGDAAPSTSLIVAAKNADILIHESTFGSDKKEEALERFHSTSSDAALIAKKANVKQLLLTHISPRYSNHSGTSALAEEARAIFPNTVVATDGMTITVDIQKKERIK